MNLDPLQLLQVIYLDPWMLGFTLLMLVLAAVDFLTFFGRRGRHLDTKGVLTSLGLLGTFIGIFSGLIDFDTKDIADSVPKLLEGLKYAFLTSIVGMILAVLVHLVQTAFRMLGYGAKDPSIQDLLLGLNERLDAGQALMRQQLPDLTGPLEALRLLLDSLGQNGKTLAEQLPPLLKALDQNDKLLLKHADRLVKEQADARQAVDARLAAIQETLAEIRADLYENRRRFVKLGAQGQLLSEEATDWLAVQDNGTGLIWEHRPLTGPGGQGELHAWPQGPRTCVEAANSAQWGGFADWRLPTTEELKTILAPPTGPDRRYFGALTDPARPFSAIFSAVAAPGDATKGEAVLREGGDSVVAAKAHVLLVRSGGIRL